MKKIVILAMILAFSLAIAPKTNAATDWASYFTNDEAKSIKKMVDKYIRNQIENDSSKWEGIIGKDAVDNSIAKRKVITGTVTCSADWADKVSDESEKLYFKKVSVPDLEISNKSFGGFDLYVKRNNPTLGEVWEIEDWTYLKNKEAWLVYADEDDCEEDYNLFTEDCGCKFSDYKMILTY